MKASVITEFGGPEVLQVRDVRMPEAGPGQVAIRVAYAGVNYLDTMSRRGGIGGQPPFVPGLEVSGHIHALGEGVKGLRVGQPVAALTLSGGYAEIALASAVFTYPLDEAGVPIDLATAAAFPTIVPAAYDMLVNVARLRQGESVLVHAAAGGVGTIAGQLARHLGAGLVIGTVSNAKKAAYAQAFGYDHVILREDFLQSTRELTQGRGVDIVLEAIGEPVRSQSLAILAPLGRLIVFGNSNNEQGQPQSLPLNPGAAMLESKAIMGYTLGAMSQIVPHQLAASTRQALSLLVHVPIKIDITGTLSLEQAGEAHRLLESGKTMGKLLLQVA